MSTASYASLNQRADDLRNNARTREAIKLYRRLFRIYDQTFIDYERAAGALQQIGVSYKIDNDTTRSLKALKRALRYAKQRKLPEMQGNIQRDIGITYEYVDKLEQAKKHLEESARLFRTRRRSRCLRHHAGKVRISCYSSAAVREC